MNNNVTVRGKANIESLMKVIETVAFEIYAVSEKKGGEKVEVVRNHGQFKTA